MQTKRLALGMALCALALQIYAETGKEFRQLPVTLSLQGGVTVAVAQVGADIVATLPSGKAQSLGAMQPEEDRFGAAPLLQADFNFDGSDDLAVFESSGYMGVNQFYRLYLWDASKGEFHEFDRPISNPDLDTNGKTLVSGQRDGPRWHTEVFRSDNGSLYQAQGRQAMVADGLDYVVFMDAGGKVTGQKVVASEVADSAAAGAPAAEADIKVDKAWLHDRPDPAAKGKMYVVKGDKVKLLDYAESDGGASAWFLARYEGKKTIEKWIEAAAVGNP